MTKLEMAHEYAKELLKTTHANHGHLSEAEIENISETAFALAGAMQAEAEKRSDMERPAVLQDEWQPDWSVAPEWAVAWTYREKDDVGIFWSITPVKNNLGFFMTGDHKSKLSTMYRFGYQGSWKNSLRKRP